MKIVKPVYSFLKYQQRQRELSFNTIIANGRDLKLYWQFLNENVYEYDKVSPVMIADLIDYLRKSDDDVISIHKESARTNKTINRILSTVHTFYQYQATIQELDNPILMKDITRPRNMFKSLLEHARSNNQTKQSIFKVKVSKYAVRLVTDDE